VGSIRNFKDLVAWQKAMALAVDVYRLTSAFPADERFGLTAQTRRACVGIAANIAEGFGRSSRADYLRFLDMARGSANEVETLLILAGDLGLVDGATVLKTMESVIEVRKVLAGLIRSLRAAGDKQ